MIFVRVIIASIITGFIGFIIDGYIFGDGLIFTFFGLFVPIIFIICRIYDELHIERKEEVYTDPNEIRKNDVIGASRRMY